MPVAPPALRYDLLRRLPDGRQEILPGCTPEQVRDLLYRGRISGEDSVRVAGSPRWQALADRDEFDADIPRSDRRKLLAAPKETDDMDMTPMIDVTFLLLIFFMVTASFHLQKGLDFPAGQKDPTEASSKKALPGLPSFDDRIVIDINATDEFRVKNAKTGETGDRILPADLAARIKELSHNKTSGKLLIVAHEASSHEATVAVIDAAAQAGVIDVTIADVVSQGAAGGNANKILRTP